MSQVIFFQLAMRFPHGWLVLRLLYVLRIYLLYLGQCIHTSHMPNSYSMYIVAVRRYFGQLDGCFEYSLAQLRV